MAANSDASLPLTVVIFGASGDLTTHKLIPALYGLFCKGRLPAGTQIVGSARSNLSNEQFRDKMAGPAKKALGKDGSDQRWAEFSSQLAYVSGDASKPGGLDTLKKWLSDREKGNAGRRLYYLSVGPDVYPPIVKRLGDEGMAKEEGDAWRRLVIEKPFGRDLASARELNRTLHEHFTESQIYRIDHYLGKETVQNLLVFRFANTIFEPVWNHNFIDHVQITVSETVPVGTRGGYYDTSGVLRDMIQSHLLQVLTLVTMEAPARFLADPLRNEKLKVLEAVAIPSVDEAAANVVTGQYAGYLKEPGVDPKSKTPTYAAVRLKIDNWRWRGVPFYLRSGKALAQRTSEVLVQFHCPPHLMFQLPPGEMLQCNRLALRIQPDEGIDLHFQTKVPDRDGVVLRPADLKFDYRDAYANITIPDAYERLLQDAIHGDASLFMRSDEIEQAWRIMDPLVAASERAEAPQPQEYAVGSMGPAKSDEFLAQEGRAWILQEHGAAKPRS
jgi:glucose-6-phosphate 1-dehydrogenase